MPDLEEGSSLPTLSLLDPTGMYTEKVEIDTGKLMIGGSKAKGLEATSRTFDMNKYTEVTLAETLHSGVGIFWRVARG